MKRNAGDCGTTALHEMVLDKPLQDDIRAGMTITHVMENRWLRLMASLAGTPNLEWMLNTIGSQVKADAKAAGKNVYAYMEEMIEKAPIGSRGVMYHPYLLAGGERAPFTDPRARASYTGISVRSRRDTASSTPTATSLLEKESSICGVNSVCGQNRRGRFPAPVLY